MRASERSSGDLRSNDNTEDADNRWWRGLGAPVRRVGGAVGVVREMGEG